MTTTDLKAYFKTSYEFKKRTGMSASTYMNWIRQGYIPTESQFKLERLTKGELRCDQDGVKILEGKLLFRFHRGTLADSMKTVVPVASMQELVDHICANFSIVPKHSECLLITHYGFDDRIKWDTYLVATETVFYKNFPLGFLNGSPDIWSKK